MGRSYWFECSRCGYRVTASGKADRGFNFHVQTIACKDCRQLYDAVTCLKRPRETELGLKPIGERRLKPKSRNSETPPSFDTALNRLLYQGFISVYWQKYKLQCPVSPAHRVRTWNYPDKCPRCGFYVEKNALPYRIWD